MVLETTIICIDNSEHSRNEDFLPSRLESQREATNLICGSKTSENAENAVGLLTGAGERASVRVTPTQDIGKILQSLHNIQPEGELDVIRAIQTAQLALKHRMHKNQRQRIVLFVASPLSAPDPEFEYLGRMLKKNNVSLDIISFGNVEHNASRLSLLHTTVNNNDTSHLLEYNAQAGTFLPERLLSSPIIEARTAAGNDGGIPADPNTDPELYLALQISLQEEEARQARAAAAAASTSAAPATTEQRSMAAAQPEVTNTQEVMDDELHQALSLSLNDFKSAAPTALEAPGAEHNPLVSNVSHEVIHGGDVGVVPSEDISRPVDSSNPNSRERIDSLEQQPPEANLLIQQFLSGLPGVDTSNPALQAAMHQVLSMESVQQQQQEDQGRGEESSKEEKTEESKRSDEAPGDGETS